MSEWREVKIGDLASRITSGGTPLTKHTEYYDGNIPWLNTKEIKNCRIFETEKCITELGLNNSSAKFINSNSVIVAMYGATAGKIAINKIPLTTNQACCNITLDEEKADYNYIYYLLLSSFTRLDSLTSGAAQQNLNVGLISNLKVLVPELTEQKAIAEVLSSLDDKIDLLHRQNKTLEELAQTLFRQWFIEEVKDEWEMLELSNFVSTIDNRGKTPPNQKEETLYPVIEVNALGKSDRLVDYSVIRKYVDKETFDTWFRNTPSKYDTLVSTVGSIGAFSMFILEKGNIAQNVIALHPENISAFYLYQILNYKKDEIMQLDIGGVQPSIKVPHLLSIVIPSPDKDTQDKFDNQVMKFVDKMEVNYNQIKTLENMRDTLLPKLMSREVRVKYD